MDQNSFLVFEIMIHLESEFILGSKFIFSVKNHSGIKIYFGVKISKSHKIHKSITQSFRQFFEFYFIGI